MPLEISLNSAPRIGAFVVLLIFICAMFTLLFTEWRNQNFRRLVVDRFRAVVGIPIAALFAFGIVTIFESTAGQIRFEMIGLKFEGAAGPIVMWVLTFLAIVGAIALLWRKAD